MKWRVRFGHEQHQCCPDLYYWVVHTREVEAESEQQARDQIINAWGWDGRVEIKQVEEINE